MEKKEYLPASAEVIRFGEDDIVRTSSEGGGLTPIRPGVNLPDQEF